MDLLFLLARLSLFYVSVCGQNTKNTATCEPLFIDFELVFFPHNVDTRIGPAGLPIVLMHPLGSSGFNSQIIIPPDFPGVPEPAHTLYRTALIRTLPETAVSGKDILTIDCAYGIPSQLRPTIHELGVSRSLQAGFFELC